MAPTLTERDVIAMLDRLSDWGRRGAAEFISMVFHGYTITHVAPPALLLAGPGHQQCRARRGPRRHGLWLIDNANLEPLAEACTTRRRWAFRLTVAPLRLR